ncbi:MAG: hypothetical protein WCX64_02680 [Candidatus Micrarchaeia archaeon]|jgi:hypothetical protein
MTLDANAEKIARNTLRIAEAIHGKMPHLPIKVWDISEFLPDFHDVRRNMVFIETDPLALEEVVRTMSEDPKYRNHLFYIGKHKPVAINESWAAARSNEMRDIVVITGRKQNKTRPGITTPPVEHRLVDLLAFSLRGWLPMPPDEVIRALAAQIHSGRIKYGELMRYADRRYVGPIIEMIFAQLVRSGELKQSQVDDKYYRNGERLWNAISSVKDL